MKRFLFAFYCTLISITLVLTACGGTPPATASPPAASATDAPTLEPSATAGEPADVIFYNGNLITMEPDQPLAQALAVQNGLIQAVGSDADVLALQGTDTTLVDLQGKTLMPGFVDGHTHILTFHDRMGRTLADAQQVALEHGFTMVSEMWSNEDVVNSFLQAESAGELRVRVNLFPSYNDGILGGDRKAIILQTWFPAHAPILDPQRMLRIPGIKIFVDGDNANYERGCWAMSTPLEPGAGALARGVCGTPSGDLYWEQDTLNQVVAQAQAAGYRVAFHAMGDRAIETALNAIEHALNGASNEDIRHQIDHNSMARPNLLTRYQSLGVGATVRGHVEACDLSFLDAAFGAERRPWYVNRYALPSIGIHAFIETDFGWLINPDNRYDQRTLDPFMHLYGFVTHRYASAADSSCAPDALLADKMISVERALEMMTIEPAWAVSMEEFVGSLKPGKFADLIVLSDDPLTMDPNTLYTLENWMTMVKGQVEFCAPGHEDFCPGADALVPTATSTSAPVTTVTFKWNCDSRGQGPIHVTSSDGIRVNYGWAATTVEQTNDYVSALRATVNVDGVSVPFSLSNEGVGTTTVQSYFTIGSLAPGTHTLHTLISFEHAISDGWGTFGPGTSQETLQGDCTVISD